VTLPANHESTYRKQRDEVEAEERDDGREPALQTCRSRSVERLRRFDTRASQRPAGSAVDMIDGGRGLDGCFDGIGQSTRVSAADGVDGLATEEDDECWHSRQISANRAEKLR
jgi:hypothetical protein